MMTNDFTLEQGVGKFCIGGVVRILEAERKIIWNIRKSSARINSLGACGILSVKVFRISELSL